MRPSLLFLFLLLLGPISRAEIVGGELSLVDKMFSNAVGPTAFFGATVTGAQHAGPSTGKTGDIFNGVDPNDSRGARPEPYVSSGAPTVARCSGGETRDGVCRLGTSVCKGGIEPSVINGTTKCYDSYRNDSGYYLVKADGSQVSDNMFRSLDPLKGPDGSDTGLYQGTTNRVSSKPVVVDSRAKIVADGDVLGCYEFKAKNPKTLLCKNERGQSEVDVEKLANVNDSEISKDDMGQAMSVDLCAIASAKKKTKKGYFGTSWGIPDTIKIRGLGDKVINVTVKPGEFGDVCSLDREPGLKCSNLYLRAGEGLMCMQSGRPAMIEDKQFTTEMVGKFISDNYFGGRTFAKTSEVIDRVRRGGLRIDKPDVFVNSSAQHQSGADSSSGAGGTR